MQYARLMSNYESAYDASSRFARPPAPVYVPIYSQGPLRSSSPTFDLDLYQPREFSPDGYASPSYRSMSPVSPMVVHHHPVYSPPRTRSPPSHLSQSVSKLRQINDELCHTLAQCELTDRPPEPARPPRHHHHVYHHPASHRSRPLSADDSSSSIESEPELKKPKAKVTYKIRAPRRRRPKSSQSLSQLDQVLVSTSDAYPQDDPLTIDFYPQRDRGFVKQVRNRPDNQRPWMEDVRSPRRNSFAEESSYRPPRTPRGPDYEDKPVTINSRLARGEVEPAGYRRPRQSPFLHVPRARRNSASPAVRRPKLTFSTWGPDWRPGDSVKSSNWRAPAPAPLWNPTGSVKASKFIGSHAPPSKPRAPPPEPTWNPAGSVKKTKSIRAFDPVQKPSLSKSEEPVWRPSSTKPKEKTHKYFEPALKPELTVPLPLPPRKTLKNTKTIPSADPKIKTRIAQAESKVKSAWQSTGNDPQLPIARPTKRPATTVPVKPVPKPPGLPVKKPGVVPATNADTGRSSLFDVPKKPLFQSTPVNRSVADDETGDPFENDSEISVQPTKPPVPSTPPRAKIATPPPVRKPDPQTKSEVKDGVLIQGNDADKIRDDHPTTPPRPPVTNKVDEEEEEVFDDEPPSPRPVPAPRPKDPPKPNNRDDESIIDHEDIENDSQPDGPALDVSRKSGDVAPVVPRPKDAPRPPDRKTASPPPSLPQSPELSFRPIDSDVQDQKQPPRSSAVVAPSATAGDIDDFFN